MQDREGNVPYRSNLYGEVKMKDSILSSIENCFALTTLILGSVTVYELVNSLQFYREGFLTLISFLILNFLAGKRHDVEMKRWDAKIAEGKRKNERAFEELMIKVAKQKQEREPNWFVG